MATANSIIVLDDDDEDEAAAQPGPSHPPPNPASPRAAPNPASPRAEAPGSSQPHGAGGGSSSGGKKCYKLENEKLFKEVSFRGEDSCTPGRGLADWLSCLVFPTNPTSPSFSQPIPCPFPREPSSSLNCVGGRQQTTLRWSRSSLAGSSGPTHCFWPRRSSTTSSLGSFPGLRAGPPSSMSTLTSSALFSRPTRPRRR